MSAFAAPVITLVSNSVQAADQRCCILSGCTATAYPLLSLVCDRARSGFKLADSASILSFLPIFALMLVSSVRTCFGCCGPLPGPLCSGLCVVARFAELAFAASTFVLACFAGLASAVLCLHQAGHPPLPSRRAQTA